MVNFNIVLIENNGNEIHSPKDNYTLNLLYFPITQCKSFLLKNYKGLDTINIYVYEMEMRVLAKIDNIEYSFS